MVRSITFTPEQSEKIKELAKQEHRSFSGQLVHMAEVYLAEFNSEQAREMASRIEGLR